VQLDTWGHRVSTLERVACSFSILFFVPVSSDKLALNLTPPHQSTKWSTVMNLVKKVLETIVIIFVSGVATLWFFGTPELEYRSGYRDKYFNILSKAPKELTLEYRGERIENISVFDFNIFNRTLKDISGVRLYFRMSPKGAGKVPEIISKGLYPPTPLPEVGITEKDTGTENLYAFDIDTLKRTGSNSFYTVRFIFKGTETPEVAVSTLTKDVDIKEYSNWRDYIIPILTSLAIMAGVFVPITIIGEWWALRSRNRQLNCLSEALI
jgi:hypothetical protein